MTYSAGARRFEVSVKALGNIGVGLAVIVVAYYAIGWWCFPSTSLNYKLSVDVDDNGVMRHGEGVIGVDFQSNGFMRIDKTPNWSIGVRGEAFAVDLGARGALFVLLSSDHTRATLSRPRERTSAEAGRSALWAYYGDNFGDLAPNYDGKRHLDEFARDQTVVEIRPDSLPMLVRFRDVNDPTSVERVEPDDLTATFGAGVKLLRATVQIVDEPVTKGIETRLPWVANGWFGKHLIAPHGEPVDQTPPERLVTYDGFRRPLR